jgi:hypothetical protein
LPRWGPRRRARCARRVGLFSVRHRPSPRKTRLRAASSGWKRLACTGIPAARLHRPGGCCQVAIAARLVANRPSRRAPRRRSSAYARMRPPSLAFGELRRGRPRARRRRGKPARSPSGEAGSTHIQ